ncbi:MAG TPA: sigma-70 family RNA polymerase sigma factor [Mucilaginibacter sp.]|jgi:RNA polymerase sigma-70 factor (family 1)|nr:sigma-70 family RNA polymerase sigma factor [Mucilaginibacter sp.]
MIYQNLSDQLLLAKCSDGDKGAFREIYSRYKEFVFAVVVARLNDDDDAKDITQDIFINLWTAREKLAHLNEFKTYLYVLSRNQVVSAYRKQNVRIKGENYLSQRLSEIDHSAEDHRVASDLNGVIVKVVEQLPETMRNCYHLSKNEGKENGEIATILNISEKTVRNNVSEALKRLKLNLQNSYPELMLLMLFHFFSQSFLLN